MSKVNARILNKILTTDVDFTLPPNEDTETFEGWIETDLAVGEIGLNSFRGIAYVNYGGEILPLIINEGGGLSAFPNQSGQTTSYFTDDDGDLQLGRLVDFYTLAGTGSDWFFGHTRRFTGITGGYHDGTNYVDVNGTTTTKALAFPETIVLDWSLYDPVSGNLVGWQYDPFLFTNTDRATAITNATGFTTTSFATGWRLMGIKFLAELPNDGVIPYLNYPPFEDFLGVALWSSTTPNSDASKGRILRQDTLINTANIVDASARAFPGRIFNISEL